MEAPPTVVILPTTDATQKKKHAYLFYNVFGDTDELLKTKPDSVIPVSFGWDEETERKCDEILNAIDLHVSSVPCIAYWDEHRTVPNLDGSTYTFEPHWRMMAFDHDTQPWSWDQLKDVSL